MSEAGTCAVETPLVVAMSDELFCMRGLLPFGEEDSVWLVSGVRPLFCAKAWELWLKTEDSALLSELVEPSSGEFLFRFRPEGLLRRKVSTAPPTRDMLVALPSPPRHAPHSYQAREREGWKEEQCAPGGDDENEALARLAGSRRVRQSVHRGCDGGVQ